MPYQQADDPQGEGATFCPHCGNYLTGAGFTERKTDAYKHTPGAWRYEPSAPGYFGSRYEPPEPGYCASAGDDPDANARLIAVVPELLEAGRDACVIIEILNTVADNYNFDTSDKHAAAKRELVRVEAALKAAIAKVEGKEITPQ